MFTTIKNAWRIDDIRKKIIYTLMIILIFRIGSGIPVPFLDISYIQSIVENMGYLNLVSGGALSSGTLFALGISPHITASIVIQLLTIAIPYLENLSQEGPEGRKKMDRITRYTGLALAFMQAVAYYILIRSQGGVKITAGFTGGFVAVIIVLTFTAGSMFTIWLGERIDEKGIGNGISMLLFAGIIARAPAAIGSLWYYLVHASKVKKEYYAIVPIVIVIFAFMIVAIIVMTNAERRIPVQYAKRVVGRKMVGGQSSFIPIKVMMSGVMPVIFAGAILSVPQMIKGFANISVDSGFGKFLSFFDTDKAAYAIVYVILIIAFNYFYVAIQYNPMEMANDLRKNSGTIPGIRPGSPTSDFISRVISRITLVGALFLALLAVMPIIAGAVGKLPISLGGTSIIIVVGVALDTVKELESMMMMRHYKGFLE